MTSYANTYALLSEFKDWKTARGLSDWSSDAGDDAIIEQILEAASRYFDGETGRVCYPYVQDRLYDLPPDRDLLLDADLLEVLAVTNGDGNAIAAADYLLRPYNTYPKYMLMLRDSSYSVQFEHNSDFSAQAVITVSAIWGYHREYAWRAWKVGSTLNEAAGLNATDLTFTVTSGALFKPGQIIRIDDELMIVSAVSSNDVTVLLRGDNGSTADTHANAAQVKIWQVITDVKQAILEIASNCHARRVGQNVSGSPTITSEGVVIGPRDVSEYARNVISSVRGHRL